MVVAVEVVERGFGGPGTVLGRVGIEFWRYRYDAVGEGEYSYSTTLCSGPR